MGGEEQTVKFGEGGDGTTRKIWSLNAFGGIGQSQSHLRSYWVEEKTIGAEAREQGSSKHTLHLVDATTLQVILQQCRG